MERNPFSPALRPARIGADRWLGAGTSLACLGCWAIVALLLAFGG